MQDTNNGMKRALEKVPQSESLSKDSKDSDLEDPAHPELSTQTQVSYGRLVLLIIGLGLSVSCVSLDNTILSTAIPKISQQFQTIDDVGWYGSTYFLAICCVNLLYGRLYTFFSTKRVFLAAIALFELGSLVCGLAPTSTGLIVGRAVAGLGSGGILPGAMLMVGQNVPLHRRAFFNALIMSMASIAAVLGPIVGGALTEHATWRWCFWINLPVGSVTVLTVIFLFRDPPVSHVQEISIREKFKNLDIFGLVIFISALCCLVLALEWGGSKYTWSSTRIIALLVVFVVLLIIFAFAEIRGQERAMLPPRLIIKRNVWAASAYAAFLSGATYAIAYYFPIWLQTVKGASPTKSGIMNVPMIIGITVFSLLAGAIINVIGYYTPVMVVGSIVLSVGCGMCSTLDLKSDHSKWIGYQVLVGMGAGLGFNLPLLAVQTALTSDDIATGTAIIIFGQNLSSTIFIAIAQNVFQRVLGTSLKRFAPSIDPKEVIAAGAADLSKHFPSDVLPALKMAYNFALTRTFYLCTAGAGISLIWVAFLPFLSVKGVQGGSEDPQNEQTSKHIENHEEAAL
ncbi:MFS general substrate transporter [Penicillium herquei]|nr:MFS general substrate transporter [Penicillium herquei]